MSLKSEFEKAVYEGEFRTLIDRETLDRRVVEMGRQITKDYGGKQPIIIGVLNGAFLFMADLIRHIELTPKWISSRSRVTAMKSSLPER